MSQSTTNNSASDRRGSISPASLTSSGRHGEGTLEWLRAELAAATSANRRARLLAEIAEVEELAGDDAAAMRDYLASHDADGGLREPLISLVHLAEKHPGFSELGRIFDALVDTAMSPDERVHALLIRGTYLAHSLGDLPGALTNVREAANVEGASAAERAKAWLSLEVLAGRAGDAETRDAALAERVPAAGNPTWCALLLLDRARLAAARGDIESALLLLEQAKGQNSLATWVALEVQNDLLRDHPGIAGTPEGQTHSEHRASTLEAIATLIGTATVDRPRGAALGVPDWAREPGRAVDAWLGAAQAHVDAGRPEAAAAALWSANSIIQAMSEAERRVAQAVVTHARIRLAEIRADGALAAQLSGEWLPHETDGSTAAALAFRVAEHATASGDDGAALGALDQALRRDPGCLAARALQLDVLARGNEMSSFAAHIEAFAEQLEADEARARMFLLAAYVWGALAEDVSSAKAALSQASLCGAPSEVTGYLARALASVRGDAGWYEEATKRLFARREAGEASVSLGVELIVLRQTRGDLDGVAKAVHDLREAPGGAWLARVLQAFSPSISSRACLDELAAEETEPAWAIGVGMAAVMRAQAEGDADAARRQLRQLAEAHREDIVIAACLGDFDRQAGDHAAAATTASAAAAMSSDPELAAALFIEAGLESWQAGLREAAVGHFEAAVPYAREASTLALGWARRGVNSEDLAARHFALEAAGELPGGERALSLEVFANAAARADPETARRALDDVAHSSDDALALAAALGRLTWSEGRKETAALSDAIERIGACGPQARLIASAERARAARESNDMHGHATACKAWFDAGGALPAALEWIAAAVLLGDPREEIEARRAAASCLSGDARAAVLASAAGLQPRVDLDQPAPLVPGDSAVVRLTNLELSPPGCDPRRRAAALQEVGSVLDDDAELDALALSGWAHWIASDVGAARAAFEAVTARRPTDLAAWEGIRACAEQAGDVSLRAKASSELGALCRDARRSSAFWEQAGLAWLEVGDDANADRALEASFSSDAGRIVAFDKLFRRLRERKDHPRLLAIIARRLEVTEDPEEILKLYWEQARALRECGDQDGALRALEQVTLLDANHVGALALLGEINIRRGQFQSAAEALAQLALLEEAPAKSRVTAGVAAVDLYENKLGRFDKSLEVLLALHRAKISTLPVRERLARAAARGGAWRDATAILEELMYERPDAEGRTQAARLAMAIHRDRLESPQSAAGAIVRLLEESPADAEGLDMLRKTEHPDEVRRGALVSARSALVDVLAARNTDVAAIRQLASVGRDLNDTALEQAALGALACFGKSDADGLQTLARLLERAPRTPTVAISDAGLQKVLAPGDAGPVADLFALLGPTLSEALGPTLQACGVGRRDKVDPRSGLNLRNEIAAWAGALGLQELDVYVGGSDPIGIQGIAGQPPALVVGASVNGPLTTLSRARMAREILAIVRGTTVLRWRDEVSIAAIAVAATRLVGVPFEHPTYAVLAEIEKLLAKALDRRTKKLLPAACRAFVGSGADARAWSRRALASQDRIAVVACGDPTVVLTDVGGPSPVELGPTVAENPRAVDLLGFVLSQDYLDVRAALGLEFGP